MIKGILAWFLAIGIRVMIIVLQLAQLQNIKASIFSNNSGAGQGLSLGVLNLAIVIPQMMVSVASGLWDAIFRGNNLPAFVAGAQWRLLKYLISKRSLLTAICPHFM